LNGSGRMMITEQSHPALPSMSKYRKGMDGRAKRTPKNQIKLYHPRGLNPVVDQREELPLLPFGNPIGFVPAASRGVTQYFCN